MFEVTQMDPSSPLPRQGTDRANTGWSLDLLIHQMVGWQTRRSIVFQRSVNLAGKKTHYRVRLPSSRKWVCWDKLVTHLDTLQLCTSHCRTVPLQLTSDRSRLVPICSVGLGCIRHRKCINIWRCIFINVKLNLRLKCLLANWLLVEVNLD